METLSSREVRGVTESLKAFTGRGMIFTERIPSSLVLGSTWAYIYVSLPHAAAIWLLPVGCECGPIASSGSAPHQGMICWAVSPDCARPFPHRHWQSSSSGRGGNWHLAQG